jgi:putative membrane protein
MITFASVPFVRGTEDAVGGSMLPDHDPYAQMNEKTLLTRDWLAIDRTRLANERTFLAYVRTAITVCLVGLSFIHLPYFQPDPEIDANVYTLFGWGLLGVGAIVFAIGVCRFEAFRRKLHRAGRRSPEDSSR